MNKESSSNIEDKKYTIVIEPNDVLFLQYKPDAHIELETIQEAKDFGLDLINHQPFYSMVDFTNRFVSMSPEAKTFAANDPDLCRLRIAEALLVNSLSMKLVANTYLAFNKPKTPTKAFTTKGGALVWFAKLRKNKAVAADNNCI